jgi:hypothetical protein
MPENGGKGSLDWHLRKLISDLLKLGAELKVQHNSDSRRAHSGWPDWVIGGPHGIIVRELKKVGERPTPEQQAWLTLMQESGWDAGLWTPRDLYSGRIAQELCLVAYGRIPDTTGQLRRGLEPGTLGRGIVSSQSLRASTIRRTTSPRKPKAPAGGGLAHNFIAPAPSGLAHQVKLHIQARNLGS